MKPYPDTYENEQLWNAVLANDLPKVRAWLDKGADINCFNNSRDADKPLAWAIMRNYKELAILLIESKADLENVGTQGTALSLAAYNARTEIVKCLIEAGADVNVRDDNGNIALYAARQGYYPKRAAVITQLLKQAGAVD